MKIIFINSILRGITVEDNRKNKLNSTNYIAQQTEKSNIEQPTIPKESRKDLFAEDSFFPSRA